MPQVCLLFVTALPVADVHGTEGCATGMPRLLAVIYNKGNQFTNLTFTHKYAHDSRILYAIHQHSK